MSGQASSRSVASGPSRSARAAGVATVSFTCGPFSKRQESGSRSASVRGSGFCPATVYMPCMVASRERDPSRARSAACRSAEPGPGT